MKTFLKFIDGKLNTITMYRLILYYLLSIFALAVVLGFLHIISYNPYYLLAQGGFITAVAYLTNIIFSKTFKAPANIESVYITAMILTLITTPDSPSSSIWFYLWAGVLSMSSKYILSINKKHIFNPAAIAMVITSFAIGRSADWWAGGTFALLPLVFLGGLLIVRKIRRTDLVLSFLIAFVISTIVSVSLKGGNIFNTLSQAILHSSLFFFAFVMITEPLTTPPSRALRIIYGAIVGVLFLPTINFLSIYSTPELALVIGNIFSYVVSPKGKYFLTLRERKEIAKDTYDFSFDTENKNKFKAGQYLEWTLPHDRRADARGNRRYFTIASSPTESGIHMGVKFYPEPSTFKQELLGMKVGETMSAGAIAGDFVLPNDKNKKLVFIAGGIGVTPFRSMVKYLSDTGEKRDVVCFYSNKAIDEVAYTEVFDEAVDKFNLKMVYALTDNIPENWRGGRGFVNAEMIMKEVPDYKERYFYISGPHGMVSAFQTSLAQMGVPASQIKTDFFPGFA